MNDRNRDAVDIRVVGTGSIGRQYLSCLSETATGLRIGVSVSGRSVPETNASKIIQEPYQCHERPRVDLCIVASRTSRHVTDAIEFGPSCQTMLIEKPVAATLSDASALLDNIAQLPVNVFVASPLRFMSGFSDSRRSLHDVGNIEAVDIECLSWLPDWRPQRDYRISYSATVGEGGVLLDLIHEIDYAVALFGLPEAVSATLSDEPPLGIAVESHADITFRFSSFNLRFRLSFGSKRSSRRFLVRGSEGTFEWDLLAGGTSLRKYEEGLSCIKEFPDDRCRPVLLRRQIAAVLGADDHAYPATLTDGLLALHLVDLARASHAQNARELEVSSSVSYGKFHR